jgi:hypothetical protein
MKHEIALAVVVAVGLGVVGATIAVGQRVREPTVVENPYEAGLRHGEAVAAQRAGGGAAEGRTAPACDLAARPCTAQAGRWEVTLDLAPRPLRTMAELAAAVELRLDAAPADGATVILSFDMRDMSMGPNRQTLAAAGPGRYVGKGVLVRCPSGHRDWVATVAIEATGQQPASARFDFTVVE